MCALRRFTSFPCGALIFVVNHFLPHLNRDAVYCILKAEGRNRLPSAEKPRKPHVSFRDYEVGFIHVDVNHLAKLQDADRVWRRRYLYVAIDRASRHVHLAVKKSETTDSAVTFPLEALWASPFKVTHALTDRSSRFTTDAFGAAGERHGVQHRKTRPYTPKANGMVERFHGRWQRVLNGLSPERVLRQRLKADPVLANPTYTRGPQKI